MVPEQPHHQSPTHTRKHRPRIVTDLVTDPLATHHRQRHRTALPDRQPRERQHHARKDVNDNLLVDAANLAILLRPAAKDKVPAQQARDKCVVGPFFAGLAGSVVLEEHHCGFVNCCKLGQITRVCLGCAKDEPEFLAHTISSSSSAFYFGARRALPPPGRFRENHSNIGGKKKKGGGEERDKTYVPLRKRKIMTSA